GRRLRSAATDSRGSAAAGNRVRKSGVFASLPFDYAPGPSALVLVRGASGTATARPVVGDYRSHARPFSHRVFAGQSHRWFARFATWLRVATHRTIGAVLSGDARSFEFACAGRA